MVRFIPSLLFSSSLVFSSQVQATFPTLEETLNDFSRYLIFHAESFDLEKESITYYADAVDFDENTYALTYIDKGKLGEFDEEDILEIVSLSGNLNVNLVYENNKLLVKNSNVVNKFKGDSKYFVSLSNFSYNILDDLEFNK
jgi:hypothetical protein